MSRRKQEIVEALRLLGGGWHTRKEIASEIARHRRGVIESAVSARIVAMICDNQLVESRTKVRCPINGVRKNCVALPEDVEQ